MPLIEIDGKTVETSPGISILHAARREGVFIPSLCDHPDLTPAGSCRLCVVEIEQEAGWRVVASCEYKVAEGLRIRTDTERVQRVRKMVMELLMARCPNAQVLHDLAERLGVKRSRFSKLDKNCLLCGLCVRVCREVVGTEALGFSCRGMERKVGVPYQTHLESCIGCGACTYVCPTGAIQMESLALQRFRKETGENGHQCRHARLGVVKDRVCSNDFQCGTCGFDQAVEEFFDTHPAFVVRPAEEKRYRQVEGFLYAPDRAYTENHLWVRPVHGMWRVGLDDIARSLLGMIEELGPLETGRSGGKDDVSLFFRSRGQTFGMAFPVPGRIEAVNPLLDQDFTIPVKDPYHRGWLFDFKPDDPTDMERLRREAVALSWFSAEARDVLDHAGYASPERCPDPVLFVANRMTPEAWRNEIDRILFPSQKN